jgi:NAD(P)-dependent dehydrogenase (short-subunit alcohol dehydrogenase family)
VSGDLRDPALPNAVLNALEGLEVAGLVNLAGASVGDAIEAIRDEDWDDAMAINATGPMRLCRALVPRMKRAGGGSIVNVASPVAVQGARKVSYAASKAALLGLNVALARALGRDGIRVNAVLPGPTSTFMTADWDEEKKARIGRSTALGRLCEPREIAGVISFLLGPDSSFMTGAVLDVTGGALVGGAM